MQGRCCVAGYVEKRVAEEDGGDEAAQAFEALRAEVTLMRRAVERLAAERTELPEPPDYSETLGVISSNLTATAQRVDALVNSPALRLTPDALGRQIATAGSTARAEDHRALATSRQAFDDMTFRLGGYLTSARAAHVQDRWLIAIGAGGLIVGMLIWAVFAGVVARSVPASWQWPERMAARSLDMEMWDGGQHMMALASPDAFGAILAGNKIVSANRNTLGACQRAAGKAEKPVRCTIEVKAAGA
jgi:hypothetical protein